MATRLWDQWIEEAFSVIQSQRRVGFMRTIHLPSTQQKTIIKLTDGDQNTIKSFGNSQKYELYEGLHEWDRSTVEVQISESTFQGWIHGVSDLEGEAENGTGVYPKEMFRKLILFSGNDYLSLSSHPTVINAVAKVIFTHGMGPRGSAVACGYTNYHRNLESCLADLKKKEDCLLCPTGYSANVALMTAIGSISSLLYKGRPNNIPKEEKVAIFSDFLNHASIIDGIRIAQKQGGVEVFIYNHCDMFHLDQLLSSCSMKKKVVVTDTLFSMDGDLAPMIELVKLRRKHGFLLVIDDAHGTFVFGKNGGGMAEEFSCESEVDICVGTLSKAGGCLGGFIACSKNWKQIIQSRGRSFIFTTTLPLPIVAAAHAAVIVGKNETWRRKIIWGNINSFQTLTGKLLTSQIISFLVGSEEKAHQASKDLLRCGFHVIPITPPVVPPNSCRLRVTLSVAHTLDDLKKLAAGLSEYVNFKARL